MNTILCNRCIGSGAIPSEIVEDGIRVVIFIECSKCTSTGVIPTEPFAESTPEPSTDDLEQP